MANMRVHELAKELNITTKDIADLLDNNNKTYKTMSGLNLTSALFHTNFQVFLYLLSKTFIQNCQ